MAQQSPTDGDVKLGGGIRKWNKEVDDVIIDKRQAFKAWKAGKCTQASYNTTKRISRRVVHHVRNEADKVVYGDIGEMSMSEEAKQNAWVEHYERLLNVEFDWDPDHLSNERR